MMRIVPLFTALLCVFAGSSLAAQDTATNVLLITSEDNGPELGCYGDSYARTPNLDRLATEGVRFGQAFVATASCSESRSALLTGLFPHQNGQIGLATHHYRQFPGVPNVVRQLKNGGYRTGLIGKLHVNPAEAFPFDFRPNVQDFNTFRKRDVGEVARQAGAFFRADDGPFFLMVNFADAHLPFLRQQHGLPRNPRTAGDVETLPWVGLDTAGLRRAQADYYNCMERMDVGIGALLAELQEAGLTERTLVIYLGDHGAQFPRGKLASYESSLRVPLILRWPQHIPASQVRDQLVSSIDLVPTIYGATGLEPPGELPGLSLLPLVRGADVHWREYLHSEYHAHYPPLFFPQRTVRDGRYKLIVNLLQDRPNPVAEACSQREQPSQPSYVTAKQIAAANDDVRRAYATWLDAPPFELYDLRADPHEWRNLADDPAKAEIKARLLSALRHWQQQTADPLVDRDKLRKLVAEHDGLEKPYARTTGFRWNYPQYLQ